MDYPCIIQRWLNSWNMMRHYSRRTIWDFQFGNRCTVMWIDLSFLGHLARSCSHVTQQAQVGQTHAHGFQASWHFHRMTCHVMCILQLITLSTSSSSASRRPGRAQRLIVNGHLFSSTSQMLTSSRENQPFISGVCRNGSMINFCCIAGTSVLWKFLCIWRFKWIGHAFSW